MLVRRRSFDLEIEKKVITGMITSTNFCREVQLMLNLKYFQADYSAIIAKWVMVYYKKYREAPKGHIQDIYLSEKSSLKEADAEIIETFLNSLSSEYEEQKEEVNVDYLVDQTVAYFKERALANISENVKTLIGAGKVDLAEKEMQSYRQVAKTISTWVNPMQKTYVEKVFRTKFMDREEENEDFLFRLPGQLGHFLGGFERRWLIAFMGPMKRGKSFFLQELAFQAFINKLNVVFISLEMSAESIAARFYKRISSLSSYAGQHVYPCFDCVKNQIGQCTNPGRANKLPLLNGEGHRPIFAPSMKYKPCTFCRTVAPKNYYPASWYEIIEKEKFAFQKIVRQVNGLITHYGNRLRLKSYPAYSANVSRILSDIDNLEFTDDFVPDVIVIDYADILAPEDNRAEGRERIDQTWKTLKNIADTKYSLVATASQSNRQSMERKDVRQIDTAEDIRKLAHVDGMFSLNQTWKEKNWGVIRVGTLVHRWKDFTTDKQVMVLQHLKDSQVVLDSAVVKYLAPTPGTDDDEVTIKE